MTLANRFKNWLAGRSVSVAEVERRNAYVIVNAALALPCGTLIHPAGAECAFCNPKYVAGFCASPSYLRERLDVIHTALERP